MIRSGIGFDSHRIAAGRRLVIGGVEIPHELGLEGHSDADVLTHAVIDALLGAAGLGDIGEHFANHDPQWRGADSAQFVRLVMAMLERQRLRVGNVDISVLAEEPRVAPHRKAMRSQIASLLQVAPRLVNVKATTTEGLGFLGRAEGIAAQATVLLLEAGDTAAPQRESST
jgi:2-C-methyl-D-erythritol 2,4-cyclodiphosphate synthase